ncbi:transporter substrate-binding domain-containing protein [Mycobacterium kubicae]|uniref:transporter substrate-binding domain-containing protein n=1 Tax=Mycobacterium kubicae TaxID=120959 RepID=UPI001FD14679|nr:transporter substrate-binding domain-containing protein [Mycobacterium kubicae]
MAHGLLNISNYTQLCIIEGGAAGIAATMGSANTGRMLLPSAQALKRRHLALLAVAVAVVIGSCRSEAQGGQDDLRRISHAGVVRVCSTGDYLPFTYRDIRGQWSGLDIDMAADMARRLAVTLEIVATTWSAVMQDLGKRCDVAMGGITITADRARDALYSRPYLRDGKAAIARCVDRSKYRSLNDIDRTGVRVIVNPDGTNAQFDRANLQHATVIDYPDNNTIFEQIITGRADVMITDGSEIRYQTTQHPQLCAGDLDHPFNAIQKVYLIPLNARQTQEWVNQWLTIADNDGTYAAISRKWLGRVVGP